jgi:hypothetical protein
MTPEQFRIVVGKLDEILMELKVMNARTAPSPYQLERWAPPISPTCGGTYPGMENHELHPPVPKVSK